MNNPHRELLLPLHPFMLKLPKYYRLSDKVNTLMYVEGYKNAEFNDMVTDIVDNCYINTATWRLDTLERQAGIQTDPSKSLEDRRAVLRTRYGGFGTATIPFLKQIALKFVNGEVEITNFPREYRAEVEFSSPLGVPKNMPDIQVALEEAFPAHYQILFKFKFLTWDQLNNNNYTWIEWDSLKLEWRQVSLISD